MPEEKQLEWIHNFYAEIEHLFDGRLPRFFDIENMPYCPNMTPYEAAIDYFVGYHESRMIEN